MLRLAHTAFFVLTLFAAASVGIAYAQEDSPTAFRVQIQTQIADQDLAERVTMYARNELRQLGDVEVTNENPDYTLYIKLLEMKAGGQRIAYVIGIVVAGYFPDGYFSSVLNPRLANGQEIATKLEAVDVFENQLLSIAGAKEADLIEGVVNAIATFNPGVLEPKRN